MPILIRNKKFKIPHIRVEKKNNKNLWNILLGDSFVGRKSNSMLDRVNDITEEILMDVFDLKNFAEEIKRILKEKSYEEVLLNLTFQENKPQFKISMFYVTPEYKDYMVIKQLKGEIYGFCPSYNIKFKAIPDTREEYQYLYEGEGSHQSIGLIYYRREDLEKFAEELEKEAEKYSTK